MFILYKEESIDREKKSSKKLNYEHHENERSSEEDEETENQHSTPVTTRISCFFIILFCYRCHRFACMMTMNFSM
jgi:hypothetical protein